MKGCSTEKEFWSVTRGRPFVALIAVAGASFARVLFPWVYTHGYNDVAPTEL